MVNLLELFAAQHRAAGIAGRVDDQQLGRDVMLGAIIVGGEREAAGFVAFNENALAARVVHDVFVSHPVRHGNDDFVAVSRSAPASN